MAVVEFKLRTEPPSTSISWFAFLLSRIEDDWRPNEWDAGSWRFKGEIGSSRTFITKCLREGCVVVIEGGSQWCSACRKESQKTGLKELPKKIRYWQSARQGDSARYFTLEECSPMVRNEILFALQEGDRQGIAIRPKTIRSIVSKIPATIESILDVDQKGFRAQELAILRALQRRVKRLVHTYEGSDGTEGDIWDCALAGLRSRPDDPILATRGELDFTVIHQQWLRNITLELMRSMRPTVSECRRFIQAAEFASKALSGRPNGEHPEKLGAGDMSEICRQMKSAGSADGKMFSESHRRSILGRWRQLVESARSSGLMEVIPGQFSVEAEHMFQYSIDSDAWRAIPEEWIQFLDSHLCLMGTQSGYRPTGWKAEDLREMYRVFYKILRDTGRRPGEVASLKIDPLEWSNGQPTLIFDNHKARRYGRRLPIDKSTADIIENWRSYLGSIHVPAKCEGFLFPAPGARSTERRGHMKAQQFHRTFRSWLRLLPEPSDLSEEARRVGILDIDPYGFRHAYAQRHADNGTPVDVLRDLMDHRELETTMGYYRVNLKRKQQAVSLVSQLAVDRYGNHAPFESGVSYERASVATAYGNCTEPSNVKAGGKSCPIRFQCAGCGFFRPDPSYLAAIEQQISQLQADRAIALATDAAKWVIENFEEQIKSYDLIASNLRDQLENLDSKDREQLVSACADVHKSRQSAVFSVTSLMRKPNDQV